MIGSLSALKASRIRPRTTTRLIAPTTTGLRSRNGVLIGVPRALSGRGAQRRRRRTSWGGSSEVAPGRSGAVADRDRVLSDPDLAGEVAEVEVEPRAVDRGPAHLGQLDRENLEGPVDLRAAAVEVGREAAQVVDVGDEGRADARDEVGGLHREGGDLVERPEDRAAVLLQATHELLERRDQLVQLLVAPAEVVEDGVQVGDQLTDYLVAVREGLGDGCRVGEHPVEGPALPLEHLDDLVGELV